MNRKSKHIREVNMLLERRYLSEQVTPTTGTTTGATTPTPAPSAQPTTSPETTKISEKDKKNMIECSSISKLSTSKTEGETYKDGNTTYTIYMLNNKPYCKDPKK